MNALPILTVAMEREADVVAVRQRGRRIAELLGFEGQDQTRIATALSEIARNAVGYGGGGRAEFALAGTRPQRLVVRVADRGTGIADLDAILAGRFRSTTGMGLGIVGARRLMDGFDIRSSAEGTVVTLEKQLPRHGPAVLPGRLADIVRQLAAEAVGDPLAEMRAQNHELMRSLEEIRAKQDEAMRLNEELEKTNQGVVALYAELDAKAAELHAMNATLEERVATEVAERTQAEEALRQSQKMEAVGQLTGGLAHDFNNLLTGIMGSLDLLQRRVAQGRVNELDRYISAAQGAGKRAAALTHRLLAFSRRQTLDPSPTDVNRLVAGLLDLVRRTVGPEVAVAPVLTPALGAVLVDANQLENALLNLCINARDAMAGGGRIAIETAEEALDEAAAKALDLPAGPYVVLRVVDTGPGMPPNVLEHAFEPFFTTKPLGQGTGLGLSMVYGFTRQSGGQARITSEPGRGTTVALYLPRYTGGGVAAADLAGGTASAGMGRGETVLIVDDEPTVRMLVGEVLADQGYVTLQAADGAAGLRILQSGARVDLVVTDVGLPGGMNGRQMADAARLHRPGLKVLFITGYAEAAAFGDVSGHPGMHVLTKPFPVDVLADRVKTILAERPWPGPPVAGNA